MPKVDRLNGCGEGHRKHKDRNVKIPYEYRRADCVKCKKRFGYAIHQRYKMCPQHCIQCAIDKFGMGIMFYFKRKLQHIVNWKS